MGAAAIGAGAACMRGVEVLAAAALGGGAWTGVGAEPEVGAEVVTGVVVLDIQEVNPDM